jgi:hypothetical protein
MWRLIILDYLLGLKCHLPSILLRKRRREISQTQRGDYLKMLALKIRMMQLQVKLGETKKKFSPRASRQREAL